MSTFVDVTLRSAQKR